jgi:hypothetical protein
MPTARSLPEWLSIPCGAHHLSPARCKPARIFAQTASPCPSLPQDDTGSELTVSNLELEVRKAVDPEHFSEDRDPEAVARRLTQDKSQEKRDVFAVSSDASGAQGDGFR